MEKIIIYYYIRRYKWLIIYNIIIPTYKARETLPKALDSLVAQTKDMFLVTIVQDGDGRRLF